MKSFFLTISLLTMLTLMARAELSIYEQSQYWPYRTSLAEPFQTPEGKTLKAGTSAVLIRMESPQEVILDFGRNGLYTIPVTKTNLIKDAKAIESGQQSKDHPNYVMMIGPRLVDATRDPVDKYAFEEVIQHNYFLTIYASEDLDALVDLADALNPHRDALEESKTLAFIMPQTDAMHDFDYAERLRACDLQIPFMYGYLTPAYTRVLAHQPQEADRPHMVLTDANGKILVDARYGSITEKVDKVRTFLETLSN